MIGLRERKKAKTRAEIQRQALRLFHKQGYDETTVEDIAAAAEVSASTFFRYFPTKEEVVMYDVLDAALFASFHAQPRALGPIAALRQAVREVWTQLSETDLEEMQERERLVRSVPELRGRMLEEFLKIIDLLSQAIARRERRRPDDFAVRTLAGAMLGAMIAAWLQAGARDVAQYYGLMDKALAQLEKGLALAPR